MAPPSPTHPRVHAPWPRVATLAATTALAVTATTLLATGPVAADDHQTLAVDLTDRTGAFHGGAHGALYGLSDPDVPGRELLEPLNPRSVAQKPQGGLQHPNGDVLDVADYFFASGGEHIEINMQDHYAQWPYEDLGLEDYLEKVDRTVADVLTHPEPDRFVYLLFNEPDYIWYDLSASDPDEYAANRDRFLADWKTVYERVRDQHPDAVISGPGMAVYSGRFYRDFLEWTRDEDVLPDILNWHELSPNSLRDFPTNHAHYRQTEADLGIDPLPININEYANRRDMAVPGQLVQWVSMFEDTKVDAHLAYWSAAGNLSSNTVGTQEANGGWWLLHWYGTLAGDTVAVTPPQPDTVDTLRGVATVDDDARRAQVLLGGTGADVTVAVAGVDPEVFGERVRARVERVTFSGQEAAAPRPTLVSEDSVAVSGGEAHVNVPGGDPMAAYRVTLTPDSDGGSGPVGEEPWQAHHEAEDGELTAAEVYRTGHAGDSWSFAGSGGYAVGGMDSDDSAVTVTVDVPEDGSYDLGVLYGSRVGGVNRQALLVDGELDQVITYPATLDWGYRSHVTVPVDLTAGTHTLTLAASHPDTGRLTHADGFSVDRVELTRRDGDPTADVYPAHLARLDDGGTIGYDGDPGDAVGHVTQEPDATTTFVVSAPENGYYDLELGLRGTQARVAMSLAGERVDGAELGGGSPGEWQRPTARVYLPAGISQVGFTNTGAEPADLDTLRVTRAADADDAVTVVQAEDPANQLTGGATVVDNEGASGGAHVGWIGNGAELTIPNLDAHAGTHAVTVHYANDERDEGHDYNFDIISRRMDITTPAGTTSRMYRNTYGWSNFWSLVTRVELVEGENDVTFGNPDGWAPDVDRVEVAPLLLGVD